MRTNRMLLDDVGGLDIFILMARALTPPGMMPQPDAHWDRHDAPATDVHDLEMRMRALERGVPHPYY